ncbi:MAG: type II toxin-antitoxin system VapC family toxin [Anaerolineales bacterium]|nr:type II toxin-antitoxin system VapC family toxin [Anaerolineales bacterium]
MKYMLDTNICIGLIRQKPPSLIKKIVNHAFGDIGLSTITVAELMYGAQKSNQPEQNMRVLEQFLLPFEVADFDQSAANAYGILRAYLEKSGKIIGSMDMLIGAHALSLEVVLATNNIREFKRIPNLMIEDWMS